jgi:heme exporter protein A
MAHAPPLARVRFLNAPLLAADGLTVERGGRLVLRDLAIALAPGETVLVAGRNGAGKSTLLRTLAGLLHPAAGTIAYGRADEETSGVETIHYLGYEDALKPSLTVRENLAFWAAMLGTPGGKRHRAEAIEVAAALEAYGIARLVDLPAGYLSAGQKRRVALARLLLAPRPIWLLDEPLIALDVGAQDLVVAHMAAHAAAGGAILVASHQPLKTTRTLDLDAAA